MEMAHIAKTHIRVSGVLEDRRRELVGMSEEAFLKNLYLFMKKRDTPIERIPHLGFKQIDLFLMFKTVRDLGGYHQVTAQQLWKQVYNSLGGNPRSTSAATCTRRHYEKLLLAYECHLKGMPMNLVSAHAVEHYHHHGYGVDDMDGPRPAKRKMMSLPLHHQNHPNLPPGPHHSIFPLQLHPPHYYHPSPPILPPYVPMSGSMLSSHRPQIAPPPKLPFPPCGPATANGVRPLEHLRFLSEQYKSSSGLSEPLNLSIKAESQMVEKNPKSSFSPLLAHKTPKFLNTPSSLYKQLYSQGERKMKTDEAATVEVKTREDNVVDLTSSSSPEYDASLKMRSDNDRIYKTNQSPIEYESQTEDQESSVADRRNINHTLPIPPRENNGKMEIEIPLSVFHNWLRTYGQPGATHDPKMLPHLLQEAAQRSKNMPPAPLAFHPNFQQLNIKDLRVPSRKAPSPKSTDKVSALHHVHSLNSFTSYRAPTPSSSASEPSGSLEASQFSHPEVTSSSGPKTFSYWEASTKDREPTQSPSPIPQDLTMTTSRHRDADLDKKATEMNNLSSTTMNSTLHLTSEEVMKLKKIISGST
ncbi:AT-rich interaction domain 6 [Stigmatopora nigra]